MILFSPAKINIGLHILEKRQDGFHDLDTLMLPLPFHDIIEIKVSTGKNSEQELTTSGIPIPGDLNNNLCVKAFHLFNTYAGNQTNIKMHLYKQIPVGAGLGGGSSNASSMLLGLNQLSGGKLSVNELTDLAAQLGSDCPLFIHEKVMLATGRGDLLEETDLNFSGLYLVLCNPGIVIPTADAYRRVKPFNDRTPLKNDLSRPISEWKDHIINDFEESVFQLHPEIESLKRSMSHAGAIYTSMSGSGSSVYGIFRSRPRLPEELLETLVWQGGL